MLHGIPTLKTLAPGLSDRLEGTTYHPNVLWNHTSIQEFSDASGDFDGLEVVRKRQERHWGLVIKGRNDRGKPSLLTNESANRTPTSWLPDTAGSCG